MDVCSNLHSMFVCCDGDGRIIYADSRLLQPEFQVGSFLPGIANHQKKTDNITIPTTAGLLELCRVDTDEFSGYIGSVHSAKGQSRQYSSLVKTWAEEQPRNDNLIFHSPKMKLIREMAIKFAKVDVPLLITGESGVGKEVIADLIYQNSCRNGVPFLKLNCGAIPETLLEAELFGYEGGAFTGAKKAGRPGLLEVANGGTLMLDEIGELSLALQVKLLRVVQQQEFFRIGGKKVIKVDIRIIAVTNRDLQEMVRNKEFRADLFYRLNVLKLDIPPLRERPEDIIPIMEYFLQKYNRRYNVSRQLAPAVYHIFVGYPWLGNVRELENLMERLVVICDQAEITPDYLPAAMRSSPAGSRRSDEPDVTYKQAKEAFEREFFRRAISKHQSSRRTAERLGIDHSTIVKKAAKYGISLLSRLQ